MISARTKSARSHTQPWARTADDLGMIEPPPYLRSDAPVVPADVDSARHRAAVARIEHELGAIDRRLARLHDRGGLAVAWSCLGLACVLSLLALVDTTFLAIAAACLGSAIVLAIRSPRLRRDSRAVHEYLRR